MFKWVLVAAFLLAVLACAGYDVLAQRKLEERRVWIAQKRVALQALRDIDQEVRAYQKQKDALQVRIDLINQMKQTQETAAEAVATLSTADASIESAAVIDAKSLVVNTPSGARTLR